MPVFVLAGVRSRVAGRPAIARWLAGFALLVSGLTGPAAGQLTLSDNRLFGEEAFDVPDAFNRFGITVTHCDFNGDGYADLAMGSPYSDLFGIVANVGVVHIAYGGPLGLTAAGHQTVIQPASGQDPPSEDDRFGEALGAADFNNDGYCDLVVGRPSASFNGLTAAGLVHEFSGTENGLDTSTSKLWWQDEFLIADDSETDDRFGTTLVGADFDGDGFGDLAIGVPFEDSGAGAVHILYGGGGGLSAANNDFIAQGDALGTAGIPEAGDRFGLVMAIGQFDRADSLPDLAIAAPFEDIGPDDAGQVHVFYPNGDGFVDRSIRQSLFDQANTGQTREEGDLFGIALAAGNFDGQGEDELAIGSEEGVVVVGDRAGNVTVLLQGPSGALSSMGALVFNQDTAGISDSVEANDVFGGALAAGDFNGDGRDDLAIGVPNEGFEGGGLINNGAVHALYGSATGLVTENEQFHGQGVWGAGATESGDFFGAVLASADFDDDRVDALVVGVPNEDRAAGADAGVVVVITGNLVPIFGDGFESGTANAWSVTVP